VNKLLLLGGAGVGLYLLTRPKGAAGMGGCPSGTAYGGADVGLGGCYPTTPEGSALAGGHPRGRLVYGPGNVVYLVVAG